MTRLRASLAAVALVAAAAGSFAGAAGTAVPSIPDVPAAAPRARSSTPAPAARARVGTLYVRDVGSDDAAGTVEAPLRTITAALARGRAAGGPIDVHVSVGTFDAAAGERFPLDLTGGVSLRGLGSEVVTVDAGDVPVAVRLGTEAPGRAFLGGMTLRGGGVGIALGSSADAGTGRDLALVDVRLAELETGVALELGTAEAPLPVTLDARGLRTAGVTYGLRVLGEGHLRLTLDGCDLRDGVLGLSLEADPAEDVQEPRTADEEGVARVHHDVLLRDTTIAGMSRAGVLRVGRDGRNDGGPYRFEGCTFRGNRVGVDFQRPCLDAEIVVRRSRFLDNEQFGLHLTGHLGTGREDAAENLVEDCLFRWNGVGAHVTSSQLPFVVRRSRFVDNVGNGLFVANFLTDPTRVVVESSLFARNGSHGLYSLADARLQSVAIRNCTIVDNDGGGIRDHRRHSGTSEFELRGCIVVGNGEGAGGGLDLVDLDPALVFHSLVGGAKGLGAFDEAFAERGNLTGVDPGFADRALGDYRPVPGSPASDALPPDARAGLPPLDLTGHPFPPATHPAPVGCLSPSAD